MGVGSSLVKTLGRQAKEIWTDCWNTFGCRLLGLFEERRRTRYTVPVSQKE